MHGELAALIFVGTVSGFAASETCRPCHSEIYARWSKTAMASSSGAVGAENRRETFERAAFTHARSGATYGVKHLGDGISVDIRKGATRAETPLRWFVGSGAEARSYLLEAEGFLFQAPVAWYAREKRWDLAPGYRRYEQP